MLIDEFLCKREVLGKRAPHSFTPPLSVVGVSNSKKGQEKDVSSLIQRENKNSYPGNYNLNEIITPLNMKL
jgi:hypothetical protein